MALYIATVNALMTELVQCTVSKSDSKRGKFDSLMKLLLRYEVVDVRGIEHLIERCRAGEEEDVIDQEILQHGAV